MDLKWELTMYRYIVILENYELRLFEIRTHDMPG